MSLGVSKSFSLLLRVPCSRLVLEERTLEVVGCARCALVRRSRGKSEGEVIEIPHVLDGILPRARSDTPAVNLDRRILREPVNAPV